MASEPPPFQESTRCDVCKCSFNAFRRRHLCRCCGRTLCAEHSSDQMALPQFCLHSPVRVCANCYNDASCTGKPDGVASFDEENSVTDSVAGLDINTPSNSDTIQSGAPNCTCGMPLCICQVTSNDDMAPVQPKPVPVSTAPKKARQEESAKNKHPRENSQNQRARESLLRFKTRKIQSPHHSGWRSRSNTAMVGSAASDITTVGGGTASNTSGSPLFNNNNENLHYSDVISVAK